jgi:PleD family two-component response regulator
LYDPVNTSVGFLRNMKVLAVDDNEMHCYALRKVLEHAGFEVCVAHNGTDALAIAREEKPDVVLLDIHLPDVTGYDVCTLLKQDDSTSKIAVVFHSATVSTGPAKSYATRIGGAGFLTYPIEPEQLTMVIRGAATRVSGRDSHLCK